MMGLEFWEPWQPQIDDVVTIRVSPECPCIYEQHGDSEGSQGLLGRVEWVRAYSPNGHRCIVRVETDGKVYFPRFAVVELQPYGRD